MNLSGLTDSLATLGASPNECPHCHTASRIAHGLCLACLLRSGEEEADNSNRQDDFEAALDAVAVADTHWRLGNYEILEEIGRGGMGVIYRARQRHSRRIVALKRVLSYHADSRETLARFRREAEAAASLDHPNVLPIYEVGESEEGVPYFSMKYASGGSLQEVGPALRHDSREIVRLMAKVTRAVQYAHRQGILHRDLKPGNVLLDGRGEPMVSDFGLAKWLDASSDLTRTLTIFGTPGYIAPEQAEGPAKNLKPAADIYSLGAILFDLLTGRPPFLGEHALAVIHQASEKPAPKLRSLVKGADKDLEIICARCLEREATARYRSAGDLAEDLERWLEGRPIVARPVLPPVRLWRWARRNPVVAGSFAACLLLAIVAGARQIQGRRLEATVREEALAAHSIAVMPYLDLDRVQPDSDLSKTIADELTRQMSAFGPVRLTVLASPPPKWTGIGNVDSVRIAAQRTRSRVVIAGTSRQLGQMMRLSLHLIKDDGADTSGGWTWEMRAREDIAGSLTKQKMATAIYRLLDPKPDAGDDTAVDAAMLDDTARSYFNAGTALLDRRTILDMDRAVTCFEGAIRAAPRTVAARSYLTMACIGRNFLSSDPALVQRALQAGREALDLSPNDAIAHRGLCALQTSLGQFQEALEHGFRSLESGDPTERAFAQIAYIWKRLGRPELAIDWYQKAKVSEHQPDYYNALLGDCWLDLLQDEKASEAFLAARRFRPELAEGWLGLCQLKLLHGDIEAARALYRESASEYDGFPVAKQMEAHIEFFGRNFEEAERLYSGLEQSDPNGTGAQQYGAISYRSAIARLALARGDATRAQELTQTCLTKDRAELRQAPGNAELLYRLAAEEATGGEIELALDHLQKAIDAGWLDYRSAHLDPRFDAVANDERFKKILSEAAAKVAALERQTPAGQNR